MIQHSFFTIGFWYYRNRWSFFGFYDFGQSWVFNFQLHFERS